MSAYALKVIENNGAERFVCQGLSDTPTRFRSLTPGHSSTSSPTSATASLRAAATLTSDLGAATGAGVSSTCRLGCRTESMPPCSPGC